MERLKALSEFLTPDSRMECFNSTLEWDHGQLEGVQLLDSVPQDVQSYFETIKNLCLYGRLVYPFYSVAHLLTFFFIELVLRIALGVKPDDRTRTLRSLLDQAITAGMIREDDFSHVRRRNEEQAREKAALKELDGVPSTLPQSDQYFKVLVKTLPSLRNIYAHPKHINIVTPGMAFHSIRFAGELANQLFAPKGERND